MAKSKKDPRLPQLSGSGVIKIRVSFEASRRWRRAVDAIARAQLKASKLRPHRYDEIPMRATLAA